jgi:hypothetical protein
MPPRRPARSPVRPDHRAIHGRPSTPWPSCASATSCTGAHRAHGAARRCPTSSPSSPRRSRTPCSSSARTGRCCTTSRTRGSRRRAGSAGGAARGGRARTDAIILPVATTATRCGATWWLAFAAPLDDFDRVAVERGSAHLARAAACARGGALGTRERGNSSARSSRADRPPRRPACRGAGFAAGRRALLPVQSPPVGGRRARRCRGGRRLARRAQRADGARRAILIGARGVGGRTLVVSALAERTPRASAIGVAGGGDPHGRRPPCRRGDGPGESPTGAAVADGRPARSRRGESLRDRPRIARSDAPSHGAGHDAPLGRDRCLCARCATFELQRPSPTVSTGTAPRARRRRATNLVATLATPSTGRACPQDGAACSAALTHSRIYGGWNVTRHLLGVTTSTIRRHASRGLELALRLRRGARAVLDGRALYLRP